MFLRIRKEGSFDPDVKESLNRLKSKSTPFYPLLWVRASLVFGFSKSEANDNKPSLLEGNLEEILRQDYPKLH